jgi:hypothetical protein
MTAEIIINHDLGQLQSAFGILQDIFLVIQKRPTPGATRLSGAGFK